MAKPRTVGKTVERGYDYRHKAERQRWQAKLDQGHELLCTCRRTDCPHHTTERCPVTITHGDDWDLGHTDDRTGWTGVECVPCNRSAGGRNARASQNDPMTIRAWCAPRGIPQ